MPDDLLIVAGEASGDLHGARLLAALRRRRPGLRPFGLGGDELAAAGCETLAHSAEIAVVGITEVARVLPRARQIFHQLLAETARRDARAAILVDFPDFNLRLARQLAKRGVRVFYYVSPQVWAWRRGRLRTIARVVDTMLVLFPFEVDFYRRHGVDVVHVGHPLVDEVPVLPSAWDRDVPAPRGAAPLRLALLPGSRRSEVEALIAPMLGAARLLAAERPVEVRLIRAPTVGAALVADAVAASGLAVEVVGGDRFAAIADSHLALCASGTATLEVGLLGTPMVVHYRLARWTYLLARLLVRLPYFSLVNLVLGRRAVPELLQGDATPEGIAAAARQLLDDPDAVAAMRRDLAELRGRLGAPGASERAADEIARRWPAAEGAR